MVVAGNYLTYGDVEFTIKNWMEAPIAWCLRSSSCCRQTRVLMRGVLRGPYQEGCMARHFFLEKSRIHKDRAVITGDEVRHIRTVLRHGRGDTIHVVDEDGCEYRALITACTGKGVEIALLEKHSPPVPSQQRIVLGQALSRFQTMDYIVQKATELGVSTIIPFIASRSTLRLSDEQLRLKQIRWQKIAREATKQCGRKPAPAVEQVRSFKNLVQAAGDNLLKIMLWEDEKNTGLKEVIQGSDLHGSIVLVGPEGGFTHQEVALARHCGYRPVGVAQHILRTETAALYVLSVLHYEWETFP